MKIKKSLLSFMGALMVVVGLTACTEDWGGMDPEAGNQVYPSRQEVATYDFEYTDEKPEFSDLDITNEVCEVVKDDSLGSNVLHLSGKGAARIANPFNSVKLQNGAGIAFYVKTDSADLDRPLIKFGSETDSKCFYITPNGQVVYSDPTALDSRNLNENDPATYKTGILTPGKWHFVALQISKTGYQFYIDGKKSLSGAATSTSATDFSYQTLIDFIQSAPYIYIGTNQIGDEHNGLYIDNLALIRNQMESKDWNKSASGTSGGGDTSFKYIEYVNSDGTATKEIGTSDCSAGWWTTFSDYYRIPAEGTIHLKFTNHTSGSGNWNNWNLCISTDDVRNGSNYSEYVVLRSDAYGWGNSYASGSFSNVGYPSSDDEWTDFRSNMEGAVVDMTIARSGKQFTVTAVETCPNGKVYTEVFTTTCNDASEVLRAFLIVDGSYLVMDESGCTVEEATTVETTEIGTSDCSAGWWTTFSDYFQIPSGATLHLGFTNHTSGSGNWNNWNLCISTDDVRNGSNYSEYVVLRSDAYGWGNSYASGSFSNVGYPSSDAEWTDFRSNMEGAVVKMSIARSGKQFTVTAVETCPNGKVYTEVFTTTCNDASEVLRAFLIVDGSYLVMDAASCYLEKPMN